MLFFEKKYINDEFLGLYGDKEIYIIKFNSISSRTLDQNFCKDNFPNCHIFNLIYESCSDEVIVNECQRNNLVIGVKNLIKNLDKSLPVLLEITNIDLRVLGVILKSLRDNNFSTVICLYITPYKYKKAVTDTSFCNVSEGRFDLCKEIGEKRGINGYLIDNDDNLKEKYIVLLGFERERTFRICNDYDVVEAIPVLTLPPIRPGWQNFALTENRNLLDKLNRSTLEYVDANSISSIYKKMSEWQNAYKENFLRIIPLGTKINALGVLLYVLNNPKSFDIIYDSPIENDSNTMGINDYFYFDISEFLKGTQ